MIKRRLESSFGIKGFMLAGSHQRETAIRKISDVDFFAVFPRNAARWGGSYVNSQTFLENIRADLGTRFWQTLISRDRQAIVIQFKSGDNAVDVVPAIFDRVERGVGPIFMIPDGEGDWLQTSPYTHTRFIANADKKSGYKLRRTAQILKFWRYCRTPVVPLSSFHIELLLAASGTCEGVMSYPECVAQAFYLMVQRKCASFRDPTGISGLIHAVKTQPQRDAALGSLGSSCRWAWEALEAERNRDNAEACYRWSLVFNHNFPSLR